ncbi:hypothetical protein RJT34_28309 [Clitoria ternatea]|uniref:Uncharacterized protein n=1 Tax=Clitoria ternatea TaxID=43366 RepID=A0AAN9FDT8_CLITE
MIKPPLNKTMISANVLNNLRPEQHHRVLPRNLLEIAYISRSIRAPNLKIKQEQIIGIHRYRSRSESRRLATTKS